MVILPKTFTAVPALPLDQRVAELERRLAILEQVLQVGPTGTVSLRSGGTLTIEASAGMELKAAGSMKLMASGTLQLKGATIQQN